MIRPFQGWADARRLASRLKERILIEAPFATSDGQGGMLRTWEEVASCYAEVTPLYGSASERFDAEKQVMQLEYRITLRARADVTPAMRVRWNGKTLNIRAVIAQAAMLELLAEEGVAV